MKNIFILFFCFISISALSQKVEIKDPNLKNELIVLFDKNSNGKLDKEEIENVTELKLDEKKISDISGLESFKNLKILNLRKNNISDFSLLNKLPKLEQLYIGENKAIGTLNLNKLVNLEGIYAFRLELSKIKLNSKKLKYIYLQDNLFTKFDASNFPILNTLNLDGCKPLNELNIISNTELVQLYLLGTSIKKLNVSNNKNLKTMYIENSVKLIKDFDQEYLKPAPIIIAK